MTQNCDVIERASLFKQAYIKSNFSIRSGYFFLPITVIGADNFKKIKNSDISKLLLIYM